jgi:hypothetical protein
MNFSRVLEQGNDGAEVPPIALINPNRRKSFLKNISSPAGYILDELGFPGFNIKVNFCGRG